MLNSFILSNSLACSSMSHRFSPKKCSKWIRSEEVVELNSNYFEDKTCKAIACAIISKDGFYFTPLVFTSVALRGHSDLYYFEESIIR